MNRLITTSKWPIGLSDPSGERLLQPRSFGYTMVMDKGLGLQAFEDFLACVHEHIDILKLGFGTSALLPPSFIRAKTLLAKSYGLRIMPGGTLLEIAIAKGMVDDFFHMMKETGFNTIEVSDGSITLSRSERRSLISRAVEEGYTVSTEYGKKLEHNPFQIEEITEILLDDLTHGAQWMTLEGRESGVNVGVFDTNGNCNVELIGNILAAVPFPEKIMWEAPHKNQQLFILKNAGVNANIGNVAHGDVIALEALRRGLRADTFLDRLAFYYEI
ncbi:phosphosulfolactate synthase [Paenibacillus sp. ACRRX]|uniref:phosphosulfolactate synthase n=1 Tax=Paenibacillus sp. ACRRX TaxID=2918206 RepID=UPI001EF6DE99|nr:phosphosulfolactate synthase [Paenibacillus sp. ACRRX]MCG7406294.1 phosphosulfolactate synthase [Paenibacillus sp. ACRRX]